MYKAVIGLQLDSFGMYYIDAEFGEFSTYDDAEQYADQSILKYESGKMWVEHKHDTRIFPLTTGDIQIERLKPASSERLRVALEAMEDKKTRTADDYDSVTIQPDDLEKISICISELEKKVEGFTATFGTLSSGVREIT